MPSARFIVRILVLAVIAMAVVAVPADQAAARIQHDTADSCCACEAPPVPPAHDDCCDGGCHGCFLPCCGGPVSLHTRTVTFDPVTILISAVVDGEQSAPQSAFVDVFHPPRA